MHVNWHSTRKMLCARGMQRNAHIELEYSQDDVAVVSVGIQVLLELYGVFHRPAVVFLLCLSFPSCCQLEYLSESSIMQSLMYTVRP